MKKKYKINRREFIKNTGGATLGVSFIGLWGGSAYGAPGVTEADVKGEYARLIPADKGLDPAWIRSLYERGTPKVYSDPKALEHIGMPVGGFYTGTVYLGGDGRLWYWNIRNDDRLGLYPMREVSFKGRNVGRRGGVNFVEPVPRFNPFKQNFALRINGQTRTLDKEGFSEVTFVGQYPIGEVSFADSNCPLKVKLSGFSPFIPMNTEDSSLPVTVMSYELHNDSNRAVECDIFGWLENPVCFGGESAPARRRNTLSGHAQFAALECSAEPFEGSSEREDVVFEDFERGDYGNWTVEGDAFGSSPIRVRDLPSYMGNVGAQGNWVVNSHASAPGQTRVERDRATGRLISPEFTVSRRSVNILVGGGNHPGEACVNVIVDGEVVGSVTGSNRNRMELKSIDLTRHEGKTAHIEIVDSVQGGWGNISVDSIVFSDQIIGGDIEERSDYGTMVLAMLTDSREGLIGSPESPEPPTNMDTPPSRTATAALDGDLVGSVGRKLTLQPGEKRTVTFLLSWHFPNLTVELVGKVGNEYAVRFENAVAAVSYVAAEQDRLFSQTRLWRDTWYDSSLPYWFLDRTMSTISCNATTTAYRFASGRYWAWEGVGCCPGTCTHVWHYAQALGRLFPDVERDQREDVDFGVGMHPDGGIGFRIGLDGPDRGPADDGQTGRILGAYREHQMSKDDAFLRRNWPKIKKAMQWMIERDMKDGTLDGVIEIAQHNTLDAAWYGRVSFLVSMYLVALRACQAMGNEIGDTEFARRCESIADKGSESILELFNGEFFFHKLDPDHLDNIAVGTGCYIDQVLGQFWAHQVNLGYLFDKDKIRTALQSLYRYNFVPHTGRFREVFTRGRWYAMDEDMGLIMCTWPKGGLNVKWHNAWQFGYFNECMTGFEWQAAAHMIAEDLVEEGLVVSRAIHDRYDAALRNPYNEVECSDHYSRAMASYGTYLALCGYESHGPKKHLGFLPKLRDGKQFRCAFSAAGGWGTYSEDRTESRLEATVEVKWGDIELQTLALDFPANTQNLTARLNNTNLAVSLGEVEGKPCAVFESPVKLEPGMILRVQA